MDGERKRFRFSRLQSLHLMPAILFDDQERSCGERVRLRRLRKLPQNERSAKSLETRPTVRRPMTSVRVSATFRRFDHDSFSPLRIISRSVSYQKPKERPQLIKTPASKARLAQENSATIEPVGHANGGRDL